MLKKLKKFFKPGVIAISIILLAAFFIRVLGVNTILGFYYDQGRDASVIWDLIHSFKLFLIGPTTGLPGVFRGPYYYYLIAPFYFLGRGNPVWPSVFLSFTTVVAVYLAYYLGTKIQGKTTGVIAALIAGFSFNIIFASRWLSNPTPMLLLSMVLVWSMIAVTEGKKWGWPVIGLVSGLSLFNFGSSGELFYFPAIAIFLIWQWKNRPNLKNLILSIVLFVSTFAPLVLFDFKHQHILSNNIFGTFGSDSGSFQIPTLEFIKSRSLTYLDIFTNKIFQNRTGITSAFLVIAGISFLAFLPKLFKNTKAKVVMLLLASAILGLYFYQGNYGILYDYYMTGYYLIFVLLFAIVLSLIWKQNIAGKLFVLLFFTFFFVDNLPIAWAKATDGCDSPTSICFINQKEAINWIYRDAGNRNFNVDVYVPPVIPYSYNYLFIWLGTEKYHKLPDEAQTSLLYTLSEVDPPHPERLKDWLTRQNTIGDLEKETSFGGITVQRRQRVWYQN